MSLHERSTSPHPLSFRPTPMTLLICLQDGGVIRLQESCQFVATNSSFEQNTASRFGGVAAFINDDSKFSARNCSFVENRALAGNSSGDVIHTTGSNTFELYNATALRGHANVVSCDGTGTLYAALLQDMNLTEGIFTLGGSCVLFLYQTNGDGSQGYANKVLANDVVKGGTVNFVQWPLCSVLPRCLCLET